MTQVARALSEVATAPSVVTIGVFDGVHRGHRSIVDRAVAAAGDQDLRAVAVTFDPHPSVVVRPGATPPLLQPLEDRVALLAGTGVDVVVVLPFTRELAQLSPADFVAQVLAGPLGARRVVVGANFRFGARAAGDVGVLAELGRTHGFEAEAVTLDRLDGEVVSSTAVRTRVGAGDVAWAARALGRPWAYVGEVVRGEQRGRGIGFPTANVVATEGLLRPGGGVYAARATTEDGQVHDAVVNVGTRPTFDGVGTTVEAHLLDVDVDLYGQQLRVAFVARIRDEQPFAGVDALVAQIERDVTRGRSLLAGA